MGGPLSVIFSEIYIYIYIYIYMTKTELEVVNPSKRKFINGSWMILLIGEIKMNLMTCFRNLTATIQI